jgi:hypothetical protein
VNPAVRAFALAVRSRHLRIDAIVQEKCVANLPEHAAANRACNHRAAVRVVVNIQAIAIIAGALRETIVGTNQKRLTFDAEWKNRPPNLSSIVLRPAIPSRKLNDSVITEST